MAAVKLSIPLSSRDTGNFCLIAARRDGECAAVELVSQVQDTGGTAEVQLVRVLGRKVCNRILATDHEGIAAGAAGESVIGAAAADQSVIAGGADQSVSSPPRPSMVR